MNDNIQKVSIILPTHNNESTLANCLESLLSQNYEDIEIIVADDFSKDKTVGVAKLFKKIDSRVHVLSNVKRYGKAITLNRALKHVNGRYIIFMNPSDTITKDKIRKQVQYINDNPKTIAVGTQCLYVNEQGKRIGKSYFPTDTTVINKTIFTGFAVHSESLLIDRFHLPADVLHFPTVLDKKFSYTPLFIKCLRYGLIANLDQQLYTHMKRHDALSSLREEMFGYMKLWIQARFVYDLRLPLQTLFYPLVR